MKSLRNYINEKLVINNDYSDDKIVVKSFDELRKIIEQRYKEHGPGTEKKPIDFNDIDVSNIDSFCNKNSGIFEETKFEYIDISYWDVSNVKSMLNMFFECEELKSVGDLSNWDVSNVEKMNSMFFNCKKLTSIGDLSKWTVSNVEYMASMFWKCNNLKFVGDLSKWNVSNVKKMRNMFHMCGIKDKYKPKGIK